jgi:hypothetical protein
VRSGPPGLFDWRALQADWRVRMGGRESFVEDLGIALIQRFVRRVVLADPEGFAALQGRPVLYLGNHQTGVESFLFLSIVTSLAGLPAGAIAKREHSETWVGRIHQLAERAMGADNPLRLWLFDRSRPADLLRLLDDYGAALAARPQSLLVHTDGTRARVAGAPVEAVSSVLIDLALANGLPIVPVRFAGGLPTEASDQRLEFPADGGRQDYFIGQAIDPAELAGRPLAERSALVRDRINALGPRGRADRPLPGDPAFAGAVAAGRAAGLDEVQAHVRAALELFPGLGAESRRLLDALAAEPDEALRAIAQSLIGRSLEAAAR